MKELEQQAEAAIVNEFTPEENKPTLADYKTWMRVYFTQRNQVVIACGHKFHPLNEPRTNCPDCWVSYFQNHGNLTQTADEVFQKEGRKVLEAMRGKKFVTMFLRFMAGLAVLQAQEQNERTRGISECSSGGTEGTDITTVTD